MMMQVVEKVGRILVAKDGRRNEMLPVGGFQCWNALTWEWEWE